ncbi:MAG: GNAT family N-acetyltransferase [Oscillospiraceae bacterium]|nr:GNAT family N-acetyltransferase [Oscillospiraceae bacterium]
MIDKAIIKEKLTESDILDAKAFAYGMSLKNSMEYKLDVFAFTLEPYDFSAHILYYENGLLSSYASVNNFKNEDTEVTFICENETEFNSMLDTLIDHSHEKTKRLFAIVNRKDEKLAEWLLARDFIFSNTEYRMVFDKEKFVPCNKRNLQILTATPKDSSYVFEIDNEAFDMVNESETSLRDLLNTKIAYLNGEPIGKIRVDTAYGVFAIYGFVIKPNYRGKGLGREFISKIIEDIIETGYDKIFIEVMSNNSNALHLYKSIGFDVKAEFDYYSLLNIFS